MHLSKYSINRDRLFSKKIQKRQRLACDGEDRKIEEKIRD
jgi:hypothetical protein